MDSFVILLKIDGKDSEVCIQANNEQDAIKEAMDNACLGGNYPDLVTFISCEVLND